MKKFLVIISFFLFMFSIGHTIRFYKDLDKITIIEYRFNTKKNQQSKNITLKYSKINDEELKKIIEKVNEEDDCSFEESGIPKCVLKTKEENMKYDKYYIVYYGNDTYKVIYKVKEIDYLSKVLE